MKHDSVIYFLLDPGSDCIKIGNSSLKNLNKRIGELQISSPNSLKLLGVIWGDMNLEHRLHEQFSNERIRGEWFKSNDRLLAFINESWDFTIHESLDKKLGRYFQNKL